MDVSEAAFRQAAEVCNEGNSQPLPAEVWKRNTVFYELARHIQQVSDVCGPARTFIQNTCDIGYGKHADALAPFILPDPVDPLLIEAREIVKATLDPDRHKRCHCRDEINRGEWDGGQKVRIALAALNRREAPDA